MKKRLYLTSLVALLLASCSSDETTIVSDNMNNTIYGSTEAMIASKTDFQTGDKFKTWWTTGDKIGVWTGANYELYTLNSADDKKALGRFTGATVSTYTYAYYPYDNNTEPNSTTIKATLASSQDETEVAAYDHKVSNNYDGIFHFRQTMAIIDVATKDLGSTIINTLNNVEVSKFRIESDQDNLAPVYLSGEYTVDIPNDGIATGTSSASKFVEVAFTTPQSSQGATARMFTLPLEANKIIDFIVYSTEKEKNNFTMPVEIPASIPSGVPSATGIIYSTATADKTKVSLLLRAEAKMPQVNGGTRYNITVDNSLVENNQLWVAAIGTIDNLKIVGTGLSTAHQTNLDNTVASWGGDFSKFFNTIMDMKTSYYIDSKVDANGIKWYKIDFSNPSTAGKINFMLTLFGF